MRQFCSWVLAVHSILFGVPAQSVPSSKYPTNEEFRSQGIPESQLLRLELMNLSETYQAIPSAETVDGSSQVQFKLKVKLRLRNISSDKVLALDLGCFRLVKTVVFPEPLVGPIEAPNDIFATENGLVDPCKNLGPPRKIARVIPGKSYETTEQLRFKVLNDSPADFSHSLNPGVHYLQVTIVAARNWDIEKQTIVGFTVGPIESTVLRFVVKGKPRHT
jgi:hypothetical protein